LHFFLFTNLLYKNHKTHTEPYKMNAISNISFGSLFNDFEKAIIDKMFEAAAIKAKELGVKYIRKDILNIIRS